MQNHNVPNNVTPENHANSNAGGENSGTVTAVDNNVAIIMHAELVRNQGVNNRQLCINDADSVVQNAMQQNRDVDMLESKKRRRGLKEVGQNS